METQASNPRIEETTIAPTLESIANETVKTDHVGGTCPYCHSAITDGSKWCEKCGNFAKLNTCVKCDSAMQGPFCKNCGTDSYKPKPITVPSITENKPESTVIVPAPIQPVYQWDAANLQWFGEVMNLICSVGGCESDDDGSVIDDEVKKKMAEASVPVANKYLQPQGKYKEEINLAMVCIPPMFMAFYFQYVTKPRLDRAKQKELAVKKAKAELERQQKEANQ